LDAPPTHVSIFSPVVPQAFSGTVHFGILNAYGSTPNGPARFSEGLSRAISAHRLSDRHRSPSGPVISELVNGSMPSVAAFIDVLNEFDVAVIQHEYGAYGGLVGDEVVDIVYGLRVPSIVVAHTIPKNPTSQQHSALEAIVAAAGQVVVMSEAARQRLSHAYTVERRKIAMIPHGATVPSGPRSKRPSRPIILTLGLLRPGKGIERVIDAMPLLTDVPGRPRYIVAGPTHPEVLAAEGEAYREARIEQARRCGVADSVSFDSGYYDQSMLTSLIQQSSVVVLPYDSNELVTSGVLVDAIANGRPVVATAFPHAAELLNSGAGIVVDHDDPVALASALRQIMTHPRLAGSMAAEARRRAPEMAWPVVASAYVGLGQRLVAEWRRRM
jgi:glycosyltransferase involved in cell wall biosynthesis